MIKGIAIHINCLIVGWVLLGTSVSSLAAEATDDRLDERRLGRELVSNGDFQHGLRGWRIGDGVQGKVTLDQDDRRGNVLKLENNDPATYGLITRNVEAYAGQVLYFSAWIKSVDVETVDSTGEKRRPAHASLFIEASGRSNADQSGHLRGAYPRPSVEDAGDWRYVSGVFRVPEGTESIRLGVYLGGQRRVGTAWFDQVSARVLEAPLLDSVLRYPNYRGFTTLESGHPWSLDIQGRIYDEWQSAGLQSTLRDSSGKELYSESYDIPSGEYAITLEVTPDGIGLGNYVWQVDVLSPEGTVEASQEQTIRVVEQMPKVYVDPDGFTVVEGERIFPLGIYTDNRLALYNGPEALRTMADAGLNTVLSYSYGARVTVEEAREYLDNAQEAGLRVIYSIKDMYDGLGGGEYRYPRNGVTGLEDVARYVEGLQDHSALLSWYINDEMGPSRLQEIESMHQRVAELDSNHPTYQVLIPHQVSPEYLNSLDLWGSDPYPIGHSSLDLVSRATEDIVRVSREVKGVWQVLQVFDWKNYLPERNPNGYHPSLAEKRNMTYQALIHGARGILYFAYFDLHLTPEDHRQRKPKFPKVFEHRWQEMRSLLAEIQPLLPVILENNKVNLESRSSSAVQYQAWQDKDQKVILVVANASEDSATLTLRLPSGWNLASDSGLPDGVGAELNNGNLVLTLENKASGMIIFDTSKP